MKLETLNIKTLNTAKILMKERFPLMIKYFTEDTKKYMSEIAAGGMRQDAAMIKRPAHTIKSSAAQIGAENLADIAKQIEELCNEIIDNRSRNFQQLEKLCDKLKEEIHYVLPVLNKFY